MNNDDYESVHLLENSPKFHFLPYSQLTLLKSAYSFEIRRTSHDEDACRGPSKILAFWVRIFTLSKNE